MSNRIYDPETAQRVVLGPDVVRRMSRLERINLVVQLWMHDFKWASQSPEDGGWSTRVHFGYEPMYGGKLHDPADLDCMWLDDESRLHFNVDGEGMQHVTITMLELPYDKDNYYIMVHD